MRLPWSAVREHLEMIKVLSAEESLRHVTEIAAGNGLMKAGQRQEILRAWRKDARVGGEQPKRPTSLQEISTSGIGLRVVKE